MSYINNLPKAEVLSVGAVSSKHFAKGEGLAKHQDKCDEFALVVSGAITAEIEGKSFELAEHQAIVFPANTPHSLTALKDSMVLLIEAE